MFHLRCYCACLVLDAACWLVFFLWMGAPLFTGEASGAHTSVLTLVMVILVTLTWPVRIEKSQDGYCSGFARWSDALLTSLAAHRAGSAPQQVLTSSKSERGPHRMDDATTPVPSADLYASAVLCAALLLGGLCSQLDWQGQYQRWPLPHLLLYGAARLILAVGRWFMHHAPHDPNSGITEVRGATKKMV